MKCKTCKKQTDNIFWPNSKTKRFAKCNDCLKIKARLEQIRDAINAENVSYSEIVELVSLKKYIDKDDIQLLEWAGVPEITEEIENAKLAGVVD